jgi:hypothetical protein
MTKQAGGYKHDASDKKLDQAATTEKSEEKAAHEQGHAGHDAAKIQRHDDSGKDRLFEGRIQHDDADKASDRNRLEKDVAAHHQSADEISTISDTDMRPKKTQH